MVKEEEKERWPELTWPADATKVEKCLFRVYAGNTLGTCFLLSLADPEENTHYGMFATAWHVLKDLKIKEDIRLVSADKERKLDNKNASIDFVRLGEEAYDTGLIIVKSAENIMEETNLLPIPQKEVMLAKGAEIGRMGFPGSVEPEPCFFHGYISGYLDASPRYLVDGVAIHGVSGGPAFDNRGQIIGLVSAYLPNQRNNKTLPGLSMLVPINSIRHFMENLPNSIML